MARRILIEAPAKINIHLSVFPRREDGFHDILSVFQAVGLYDALEVKKLPPGRSGCELTGLPGVASRDNTVSRAWDVFKREYGVEGGVEVALRKRIPQGAGLGGGSSDAAAALRAFRMLFETPAGEDGLAALGAEIGSDVPFFCESAAAIVGGRGELVTPIAGRRDFGLLLAMPDFQIGTAEAYRWMDEAGGLDRAPGPWSREELAALYAGRPADWPFENAFARVLQPRFEIYGRLEARMKAAGARFWSISGSGAACYGVFDTIEAAGAAEDELRDLPIRRYCASPLDRIAAGIVE